MNIREKTSTRHTRPISNENKENQENQEYRGTAQRLSGIIRECNQCYLNQPPSTILSLRTGACFLYCPLADFYTHNKEA